MRKSFFLFGIVPLLIFFISSSSLAAGGWIPIGPGGRTVTSLAIDPQTPDILYAGTYGGGVFKVEQVPVHPAIIDFGGDGKTDIAIDRVSAGAWFINPSEGGSIYGVGFGGDPSDIPVTASLPETY
jgi:hypothetical protein